ncbi:hypothetical protein ACLOJK_013153 [Asimina triloba]
MDETRHGPEIPIKALNMKISVILLFVVLLAFSHGSMMGRADDPCKYAVAYVVDQVKYCQCPVHFPNCKNDECDTYCSNTYDYGQTGDATGTCKAANTCLCRFRCP